MKFSVVDVEACGGEVDEAALAVGRAEVLGASDDEAPELSALSFLAGFNSLMPRLDLVSDDAASNERFMAISDACRSPLSAMGGNKRGGFTKISLCP